MHLSPRDLMQSSVLQFSTFLLVAIILVPFNNPKTALAQPKPPGPNFRWSEPLECDYPDDDAIAAAFTGTGPDETIAYADLGDPTMGSVEDFSRVYRKKFLSMCFPRDYAKKGSRSSRWYVDFFFRLIIIFYRLARGWVYLVSRAEGPREGESGCSLWFKVQFPTLRANTNVYGIIAVNVENYDDQWIYWMKGDGDQPRSRPKDGNGDLNENGRGGNGDGSGSDWSSSVMNAVTGVIGTGGSTGVMGALGTGINNLKTGLFELGATMKQHWPAGADANNQKDQPDPGMKTDVLNLKIGELPNLPVGINEQSTIATNLKSTTAADDFDPGDGNLGMLNPDGLLGDSFSTTSGTLLGRSRRILRARAMGQVCSDHWVDDPSNPDFPNDDTGKPGRLMIPSMPIPAKINGLLYPFVHGDQAILLINQHTKQVNLQGERDYHLDISILSSDGKTFFAANGIGMTPGQEITIDAHLQFPLHLEVDDNENSPISIRYGDPLLFNTVNGVQWDSNDQSEDHRCVTDPWDNDQRKLMCFFNL
ncbi:hypothetical protein MMC07_004583 [Pseudocyphellaria aurata]|nr:hypothetical protein [Pseudocyphellaria aurata]